MPGSRLIALDTTLVVSLWMERARRNSHIKPTRIVGLLIFLEQEAFRHLHRKQSLANFTPSAVKALGLSWMGFPCSSANLCLLYAHKSNRVVTFLVLAQGERLEFARSLGFARV